MGLEAATFIHQLNASWPVGASDPKGQGDDHLRTIKSALQATFANIAGAVTASHTELNLLTGKTGTVWTSTNDGAASGLDADLLDGVQLSAIAQLSAANVFTNALNSINVAGAWALQFRNTSGAANRDTWRLRYGGAGFFALSSYTDAGAFQTDAITVHQAVAGTVDVITLQGTEINAIGDLQDDGANVIDIPRRTSGFARGQCTAIAAGITLNTSDLAAGSAFSVYNNSAAAITITQGAGVTLRLAGTTTTGNLTLSARGFCTIWCNSASEAICMGNVA